MRYEDEYYNNRNVIRTKLLWIVILSLILALILIFGFIIDAIKRSENNQTYVPTPEPTTLTGREVTPTPKPEEVLPTETPTPTPEPTEVLLPTGVLPTNTPTPTETPIPTETPTPTPMHEYSPWPDEPEEPSEVTDGKSPFIPISELFPNLATYYKRDEVTGVELQLILQNPELPHGCESVALTMVLNYYGFGLSKTYIADNVLEYGDNYVINFEGNPYGGAGGAVYAPGLTEAANRFLTEKNSSLKAIDVSNGAFSDLLKDYIYKGVPVIIYQTVGYVDVQFNDTVREYNGKEYHSAKRQHCVVLSGYDEKDDSVIVYDPINGILKLDRSVVEKIYNDFYQMAVVIK